MTKLVCPLCDGQEIACAALQAPEMAMAKTMLPRALEVMEAVLTQGAKDHPPGDWRELGVAGNMLHAEDHLDTAERRDEALWQEDHLAHALVRAAMAVQLREEGKDDTTD